MCKQLLFQQELQLRRKDELLDLLGQWEFTLPTMPAWGSSPYWNGQSAKQYDGWAPGPEPGLQTTAPRPKPTAN